MAAQGWFPEVLDPSGLFYGVFSMNSLTHFGSVPVSMSSREIAELTGKRHDHVVTDCRKLAEFYAETYSPEKAGELVKSTTYEVPQ